MDVPEQLLAILVCPACRGVLESTPAGLACGRCSLCYPVRDGIPVMIVEEAAPWQPR